MTTAGKLAERIRFDQETRVADGGGGSSITWASQGERWASVEPLRGREQLEAMKLEASSLYKVTIRNDFAVNPAWRITWLTGGNTTLNIRECPVTPRTELYRVLIAEAGVAQ